MREVIVVSKEDYDFLVAASQEAVDMKEMIVDWYLSPTIDTCDRLMTVAENILLPDEENT